MKIFKNSENETVNLECLDIYPDYWKKMGSAEFFSLCMKEAGSSLFYMDYLYPDIDWSDQRYRVEELCKELCFMRDYFNQHSKEVHPTDYHVSLMGWLYRFQDEVENQC